MFILKVILMITIFCGCNIFAAEQGSTKILLNSPVEPTIRVNYKFNSKIIDELRKQENWSPFVSNLVNQWLTIKINKIFARFPWPTQIRVDLEFLDKYDNCGIASFSDNHCRIQIGRDFIKKCDDDKLTFILAHEFAHHWQFINKKFVGTKFDKLTKIFACPGNNDSIIKYIPLAVTSYTIMDTSYLAKKYVLGIPLGIISLCYLTRNGIQRYIELDADSLAIKALQNADGTINFYSNFNAKSLWYMLIAPLTDHPVDAIRYLNARRLKRKLMKNTCIDQDIFSPNLEIDFPQNAQMVKDAEEIYQKYPSLVTKNEYVENYDYLNAFVKNLKNNNEIANENSASLLLSELVKRNGIFKMHGMIDYQNSL